MKRALVVALVVAASASRLPAQDEPPAPPPVKRAKAVEPRKFAAGKLVDPYWGVTYELPGLEEKKDTARGLLLAAKAGRVQIDVGVVECHDELSAKERRDADKKRWDEKKRILGDWAQGDEPVVWATYLGEAPSGPKRFEGWSWTTRGCRVFTVHAYVLADAEGGLDAVRAAVAKIVVGPETGAAVQVQILAKEKGLAYDDVAVLDGAASNYLQGGKDGFPAIAEGLERAAIEGVPGSRYEKSYGEVFGMHRRLVEARMLVGRYDDAVATLATCATLAEKTDRPGPAGAAVQYDFACAYSRLGKLDDAFAALDKAWARAADWGAPVPDEQLKKDPDLENCRNDPRWAKFMEAKPKKS